jgi:hypothetical protein
MYDASGRIFAFTAVEKLIMSNTFEKANVSHVDTIFAWLAEPDIQEFWDNTQAHKNDILNFINGRKQPSSYANGEYIYWIASCDRQPFAMLMTIQETAKSPIDDIKLMYLSKTGHTYAIEHMIGNLNYVGKGNGAKTLIDFLDFFIKECDPKVILF